MCTASWTTRTPLQAEALSIKMRGFLYAALRINDLNFPHIYNWIGKAKDNDLQFGLQDRNGTLGVNYISLIPAMIEGFKKQQ